MQASTVPIIDAQVHAYERNHPRRPWVGSLQGPLEVTGDDMVAAMDAVGVAGALLISPWSLYRYDASYALAVHARYPGRFGLIKPFDPAAANLTEDIAEWAQTPGTVGARIVLMGPTTPSASDPGIRQILSASTAQGLPVNIICWDQLDLFAELARDFPNTQLVLDHLGLRQPFLPPVPAQPFAALEAVLFADGWPLSAATLRPRSTPNLSSACATLGFCASEAALGGDAAAGIVGDCVEAREVGMWDK